LDGNILSREKREGMKNCMTSFFSWSLSSSGLTPEKKQKIGSLFFCLDTKEPKDQG